MGLGQKQCPMRWKNRVSCDLLLGHGDVHANLKTGLTWDGQTIRDPIPGSLAADAAAGSYAPEGKGKSRVAPGNVLLQLVWLVWWAVPFIILWGLWKANVLIFVVWLVGTVFEQRMWENSHY
jgi:hypothetical protein